MVGFSRYATASSQTKAGDRLAAIRRSPAAAVVAVVIAAVAGAVAAVAVVAAARVAREAPTALTRELQGVDFSEEEHRRTDRQKTALKV